jgi:hypothetical protein
MLAAKLMSCLRDGLIGSTVQASQAMQVGGARALLIYRHSSKCLCIAVVLTVENAL